MKLSMLAVSLHVVMYSSAMQATVGKTHFVVGMPREEYACFQQSKETSSLPSEPQRGDCVILFSPDDDIHAELLRLINTEEKSIKMAMYLFTDKDIAKALQSAKNRGVYIECITDATCLSNKFNKIDDLAQEEVPIWVYRANYDKQQQSLSNAMHHKFIIFGCGKVLTGSLNITHSAQTSNQENVIILSDAHVVQRFDRQFEKMKERCSRWMPQKIK